VRVAATPMQPADGPRLADEILAAVAEFAGEPAADGGARG
jgi:hypothetical protein